MHNKVIIFLTAVIAVAIVGIASCRTFSPEFNRSKVKADADVNEDPVLGDLGFSMLRTLYNEEEGNVLISPDSILTALSMLDEGADGKTRDQIQSVMKSSDNEKLAISIKDFHERLEKFGDNSGYSAESTSTPGHYKVANSIWLNDGFEAKSDFIDFGKRYFSSEVTTTPFNDDAVKEINDWVSDNTDNMIPNIINELSPEQKAVLINALSFEGNWEEPYDIWQVEEDTFTNSSGEKKNVEMLVGSDEGKYYMEMKGGKGFIKDYLNVTGNSDSDISFFAFLPPEGTDIKDYISNLDGISLRSAYERRKERIVNTKLPKFNIDYGNSLNDALISMGMEDAFGEKADFSNMSNDPLCIDEVIHKTHIEVDENGTRAAAVTAEIMELNGMKEEKLKEEDIIFNRPFLYGIMDKKSGQPLFLGIADNLGE